MALYFLSGLNLGEGRLIYFLLNLFLTELFGASFLIAISASTSSSLYASVIVPSVLMLFILASGKNFISMKLRKTHLIFYLSGFTIPGNQIPGWWIWLYWASPVRWCYEGLLINEIGGATFQCSSEELYPFAGTAPGFTGECIKFSNITFPFIYHSLFSRSFSWVIFDYTSCLSHYRWKRVH